MESWRRSKLVFFVISAPPTFWLTVFFLAPLMLIWLMSFSDKVGIVDLELTWTLANYERVFDSLYLGIFWKSLWQSGVTTLVCLLVGFPVAFLITFASPKWKPWLLLAIILPFWTNLLIRTYALIVMLRTNGVVNWALEDVFDAVNWVVGGALGDFVPLAMMNTDFAVLVGMIYVFLPFTVLPLYAALEKLDHSLIEASLDLGAGQLRTFFAVIVPLAAPGIASAFVITFIPALGTFLQPDLLGGTDSQLIANVIERQFRSANDWPFGAALSFILLYITFLFVATQARMGKRGAKRGSA